LNNNVNQVAFALGGTTTLESMAHLTFEEKGVLLSNALTTICEQLEYIDIFFNVVYNYTKDYDANCVENRRF